jgi:hypothetical protein
MSLIWFCNVVNPIVCFLNWMVYYWVYPISMFSIKDESVNVAEVVECSLKKQVGSNVWIHWWQLLKTLESSCSSFMRHSWRARMIWGWFPISSRKCWARIQLSSQLELDDMLQYKYLHALHQEWVVKFDSKLPRNVDNSGGHCSGWRLGTHLLTLI